jgi:hypothetical protein
MLPGVCPGAATTCPSPGRTSPPRSARSTRRGSILFAPNRGHAVYYFGVGHVESLTAP